MKKRVRTMALGALFCSYWAISTLSLETIKSNLVTHKKLIFTNVWAHGKFYKKKNLEKFGRLKKCFNFATVILKTIFLP